MLPQPQQDSRTVPRIRNRSGLSALKSTTRTFRPHRAQAGTWTDERLRSLRFLFADDTTKAIPSGTDHSPSTVIFSQRQWTLG
jgi:hypothetical protein